MAELLFWLAIALIATQFSKTTTTIDHHLSDGTIHVTAPTRDQFFLGQLYALLLLLHVRGEAYTRRRDGLAELHWVWPWC